MRTLFRACLIALLIATLIEAPGFAAPSRGLGVVLQAERARLSSGDAITGATVFDGDTFSTEASGALRLRVGAAQLYLLASSAGSMRQSAGGVSATLERGSLIYSASAGEGFELRAAEAVIRPRAGQQTLAQITLTGAHELVVTSQHGQLEVTVYNETHVVPEATTYRVEIEPEIPSPQGGPPVRPGRSRFIILALAMIAIGTGIGIWRSLISPSSI